MIAKAAQFAVNIFDWFFNLLFPGFGTYLLTLINAIQEVRQSSAITTFKTWVSYIAYFIPYDIWKGFFTAAIILIVVRIVFSIIKCILSLIK